MIVFNVGAMSSQASLQQQRLVVSLYFSIKPLRRAFYTAHRIPSRVFVFTGELCFLRFLYIMIRELRLPFCSLSNTIRF